MGQLGTDGACEDFFKSHGREGSQMVDLTQKIHIRVDSSEVTDLLDRLLDRLTKLGELPPGGVPDSFKDIVTLETDHGAADAGELVMRLNPTDSFLRFSSAVFTGNFD